jgi:hypothetical protein
VAVDLPGPSGDPLPRTMRAYAMQGTPTTVLIDARGRLHQQMFGVHEDLLLGAELGLLREHATFSAGLASTPEHLLRHSCADDSCAIG